MMNDDYYDDSYHQQGSGSNMGRWAIFAIALILGALGIYGIILSVPLEFVYLYTIFYIPMVVFFLYYTFRWAQGRDVAHTDINKDDQILESMRKHALPIEQAELSDTIRCTNCGMSFELVNAIPVESEVFLCPFCDTRLHIK
ncbi:MAG: hypothetical protein IH631_02890 [Candidatus Thorarchaeota archaeon]|jgi:hypothetical protein|nr:hypothetical protein [Candidatus Thorarchaeota archaeon]